MDIPLTAGEMVTVDLPGFRRAGGSGMLVRSSERTVYWDDCAEKLFVEAVTAVQAGAPQLLELPTAMGMRLPAVGLVANQSSFRISTNAAAFTPLVSVGRTQPVGAFLQGPALSFVQPKANETAEIQVFLEMVREIAAGETISLTLPSFLAPSPAPFRDLNNSVDCRWDPRQERLTMTLLAALATNITIRLAPGRLRLPVDGVRGSGAGFLVEPHTSNSYRAHIAHISLHPEP